MAHLNKLIAATSFAFFLSSQAFALDCSSPEAPAIADGNTASEKELIASQQTLKAYQGSLQEYRTCLETKSAAVNELAEDADAQKAALVTLYNASVDAETVVADQFNTAVRAYKSRSAK